MDIEMVTFLWSLAPRIIDTQHHQPPQPLSLYLQSPPHLHPQRPTLTLGLENKIVLPLPQKLYLISHAGAINRTLGSLGQGLPYPARDPVRT